MQLNILFYAAQLDYAFDNFMVQSYAYFVIITVLTIIVVFWGGLWMKMFGAHPAPSLSAKPLSSLSHVYKVKKGA